MTQTYVDATARLLSLGMAYAMKLRKEDRVAVVFFGDGATGAGVFHETMNIAAAQKLPLVLVCENNLYQDVTRSECVMPSTRLQRYGIAHRMPALSVDGNDINATTSAAAVAVERARRGHGPSFIEARTYLTYFHSQYFDTPTPEYRPAEEVARWRRRDPITRLAARLRHNGVTAAYLRDIRDGVQAEVESAVRYARAAD